MLQTAVADVSTPSAYAQFIVPGNEIWSPRAVFAVASRGTGGAPGRGYELDISNSVAIVTAIGAADAGTEPGTCSITWANAASNVVGLGPTGFSVASWPVQELEPGYVIGVNILNSVAADHWLSVVCWYDFIYSSAR